MTQLNMLERARQLIRSGRAPVPIPYREKAPVIHGWQKLRITEADAHRYFNGSLQNIGVLLGEPSHWLVDIDLDCDEAIAAAPHLLPATGTFGRKSTPQSHFVFIAENAAAKKYTFNGTTLVELRSTGQQTVFPPSVHPSGEAVEFCNKAPPTKIDASQLQRLVGKVAAAAALGMHWTGTRHDTALALTGALLHAGWSTTDVEAFLQAVVAAGSDEEAQDRLRAVADTIARHRAGEPVTGWPRLAELLEPDVVLKVRQWLEITDAPRIKIGGKRSEPPPADEWPEAEPLRRELPPAEPFPLDTLGSVLQPMAQTVVDALQVPPALAGQSLLAAATLAVQAHVDVEIDGRIRPTSENFVSVGATGERKSALDNEATRPHQQRQREGLQQYRDELTGFEAEHGAWKKTRESVLGGKDESIAAKVQAATDLGPEPLRPPAPRMLTSEPTYEGLVKALQNDWPSQGVFSDEGGRFLGGYAMSSDQQLKTASGLSNLWDGKPVDRTRGGDGNIVLYGRRCSMHLMVQPPVAGILFGNELLQGQGLLSRCLVCWPESTIGRRPYREINVGETTAAAAYRNTLLKLLERDLPLRAGTLDELEPRPLKLRPDTKAQFILFHDHIEGQLGDGRELAGIQGFGAKAAEHALRLAGVLAVLDDIEAAEIQRRHIEAGIALVEFYISEALRLFQAAGEGPDLRQAEQLHAWLCSRFSGSSRRLFSLREVYQKGPNSIRDRDRALRLLTVLAEHGLVRPIAAAVEINGSLCRTAWEVRP